MANELRSSGHTVGETNLHLQFTPAYRRDVFREPLARELAVAYIVERAQKMKVEVAAIDCGPDHLHMFVKQWKNWKIPILAGQLKTYSSRMMRKGHSALFSPPETAWKLKAKWPICGHRRLNSYLTPRLGISSAMTRLVGLSPLRR